MSRLRKCVVMLGVCVSGTIVFAQNAMPFELGTFDKDGRVFVGVVLKDASVIDLAQANAALKMLPPW